MEAEKKDGAALSYAMAMAAVTVWSVTFISTKYLLKFLLPAEILFCRVVIAYAIFVAMEPRLLKPRGLRAELPFIAMGLLGTTLYFLGEIFALKYGAASNVSLIVAVSPFLTGVAAHFLVRSERISKKFIFGGFFCLVGVALVILNGHFILKLNPAGDLLALGAALSFALYSIIVRNASSGCSAVELTRKSFFYALVTLLPLFFTPMMNWHPRVLLNVKILLNLAFLGGVASALCFLAWNKVIWALGAVKANNLIYFMPALTTIFAAVILKERITPFAVAGGALILAGVYISQR